LARAVIFFCIGAIFQSIAPRIKFKRYQGVVVLSIFLSLGFIDGEFMRRVETGLQIVAIPTILLLVLKSRKGVMQTSRLLLFIGKISFSIYAVHWPVLLVFKKIDTQGFFDFPFNKVGIVLITEGVVILVGAVLYFCLERPTQILARKALHRFGN
jgi:peptidoglycan/LPS O-acetylase OafA/YrhL